LGDGGDSLFEKFAVLLFTKSPDKAEIIGSDSDVTTTLIKAANVAMLVQYQ
jgi:hypothetical protein